MNHSWLFNAKSFLYIFIKHVLWKKFRRQHPKKQQLYGHLPPSRKLSKLDEPDMQDIAGEVGTNS